QNVIGADEFAPNVDDNAFTNGAAKTALYNACKAAKVLQLNYPDAWKEVADGLVFAQMQDGTTKEHAHYQGEVIKQADVNLLAYPLEIITDKQQIKKDLVYYEPKIYKDGPAMGNSILSILYASLGNKKKAYALFKKSYMPNKRPPFGVLSESAFSNNPYFATGAGGLLQVVLNGFGGLRITDSGVVQKEVLLPDKWKSLTIKGVGPDKKSFVVSRE
ncbi:MAG: glycoside hydrolase family 65 protein, partial [Bacteroidaceae bacterium]